MKAPSAVVSLILISACATTPPATPPSSVPVPSESDGLHWFRDAAEQRAIYVEVYRTATSAIRAQSQALAPGNWGVILDVDETILDNSDYQKRSGESFSKPTWDAWVKEKRAGLLPGAKEFADTVESLHGRVVLVTNRNQGQCPDTEENLRALGMRYDLILCDKVGDADKNARFRAVLAGQAGNLPALKVLAWMGDNIRDFPDLTQQDSGDPGNFGIRYFVLPNPMYGSWVKNPYR
jgi:5'-nucleotidase (lipoprotein e(P4) family)